MNLFREIGRRFLTFIHRNQFDSDLQEEMRLHRELRAQEEIERGLTPEEAYYAAQRHFGNDLVLREESRDVWGWNWLDNTRQDICYGFRLLIKSPGFTMVAVLTLALGIGANSAIFSIVNAVLLRPLPYPEPERLEQVMRHYAFGDVGTASATKFVFWRDHSQVFSGLAAYDLLPGGFNLTGSGRPEHVTGIRVSADFFRVVGVAPQLGRDFSAAEDHAGGPNVVMISDGLWRQRFGGDPTIIGRQISLSGGSYTVIGVGPRGFEFRPAAQLWFPLRPVLDPQQVSNVLLILGRLKPGVSREQAQVDMQRVGAQLRQQYPDLMDPKESIALENYQRSLTGDVRPLLWVLMGAVGLVLLIACANVANLLLTRAISRDKEVAIRTSMGAGRLRLVRQLMTESLLLAFAGGALGLLLCPIGLAGLVRLAPGSLARTDYMPGSAERIATATLDGRVLVFAMLVACCTGLLFGLAPLFQTSRINLNQSLREGAGRTTDRAWHGWLRGFLVVGEIGLAMVLLTGAALLIRTLFNLRHADPGFDPHNVLTMNLSLTDSKYTATAAAVALFRDVVTRVEATPGVENAAFVSSFPMEIGPDLPFLVAGHKADDAGDAQYRTITPGYFATMKIALLQGRTFRDADNATAAAVVAINKRLARDYFPRQNPIGQHLTIGVGMGPEFADRPREVVGVVGDTKESGLADSAPPTLFIPWAQLPDAINRSENQLLPAGLVVRTRVLPMSLSAAVARQILEADSTQPVFQIQPLEAMVGDSVARQHFDAVLLGIFAALALLLASIGLYGVISYSTAQRTHEIGIRLALGAQPRDVLKLIIRQGVRMTLAGVGVGLAGGIALTRFLSALLYGVSPSDPLTYISMSLVLGAVAVFACYIPARWATKVDPIVALRYE
jgi:predicted permease